MSHTETMGDRLRAARKERRLVQAVAAEAVGISRNHLTEIENGKDPGFQTFCALADFYQTSMDYLYRGKSALSGASPDDVAQNDDERRLLAAWRSISEEDRGALKIALRNAVRAQDSDAA